MLNHDTVKLPAYSALVPQQKTIKSSAECRLYHGFKIREQDNKACFAHMSG